MYLNILLGKEANRYLSQTCWHTLLACYFIWLLEGKINTAILFYKSEIYLEQESSKELGTRYRKQKGIHVNWVPVWCLGLYTEYNNTVKQELLFST